MKSIERVEQLIRQECDDLAELLIEKNRAYGNTALNPVNIFSKLTSEEAIRARLDDKLSRIRTIGLSDESEDTLKDLNGYIILLRVSKKLTDDI
jgi:hypothetical protein